MAASNLKVTDEEIREALIQANGQPTKAAEILDVSYVTVWTRCKENPELEKVKQAYRGRTFQSITSMSAAAILAGVIKQPETDDKGVVLRDDDGRIVYKEVPVSTTLRLQHGNLLMNMYKGDEGIKDQLEISNANEVDLSGLDSETLNKLVAAGIKKGDE